MRICLISLLSSVALLTACQPVNTIPTKTNSTSPNMQINDNTPKTSAYIMATVPQAPPLPPEPVATLSSDETDQNKNQTEIDVAHSTITTNSGTDAISAQASPTITPKVVSPAKTFDPTKIIGFTTPILVRNLGKANMIRQEGLVEVWQYQFSSCVVDFFFYPNDENPSKLISKNWDMRSAILGERLDRSNCRDEINLYHQKISSNS